jgi:hypothetical protein
MTEIIADNIEFLTPKTEQSVAEITDTPDPDLPF